jgi:hypothetical protein
MPRCESNGKRRGGITPKAGAPWCSVTSGFIQLEVSAHPHVAKRHESSKSPCIWKYLAVIKWQSVVTQQGSRPFSFTFPTSGSTGRRGADNRVQCAATGVPFLRITARKERHRYAGRLYVRRFRCSTMYQQSASTQSDAFCTLKILLHL